MSDRLAHEKGPDLGELGLEALRVVLTNTHQVSSFGRRFGSRAMDRRTA